MRRNVGLACVLNRCGALSRLESVSAGRERFWLVSSSSRIAASALLLNPGRTRPQRGQRVPPGAYARNAGNLRQCWNSVPRFSVPREFHLRRCSDVAVVSRAGPVFRHERLSRYRHLPGSYLFSRSFLVLRPTSRSSRSCLPPPDPTYITPVPSSRAMSLT